MIKGIQVKYGTSVSTRYLEKVTKPLVTWPAQQQLESLLFMHFESNSKSHSFPIFLFFDKENADYLPI